jgi:hypothetical protein
VVTAEAEVLIATVQAVRVLGNEEESKFSETLSAPAPSDNTLIPTIDSIDTSVLHAVTASRSRASSPSPRPLRLQAAVDPSGATGLSHRLASPPPPLDLPLHSEPLWTLHPRPGGRRPLWSDNDEVNSNCSTPLDGYHFRTDSVLIDSRTSTPVSDNFRRIGPRERASLNRAPEASHLASQLLRRRPSGEWHRTRHL